MKEIKAIIQPFKRAIVIEALKQIEGLPGITVDEHVHGFGKSRGESGHQTPPGTCSIMFKWYSSNLSGLTYRSKVSSG